MPKNVQLLMGLAVFNTVALLVIIGGFAMLFRQNPILCFKKTCSNDSYPFQVKALSISDRSIEPLVNAPKPPIQEISKPKIKQTVAPLINTVNIPVEQKKPEIIYSDYTLGYSTVKRNDGRTYYIFPRNTDRDIVIKKMVVQSRINTDCVIGFATQERSDGSDTFKLNAQGNWTFSRRQLSLPKSYSPEDYSIAFWYSRDSCGDSSNIVPLFDEWIVWDNTANLPVHIIQG